MRGVILPTALFVVLVVFGLVTGIQLLVTQNFQVTRHGHVRTQARWLARAAASLAMQRLNLDASFQRLSQDVDGAHLEAWVEGSALPDVLLLRARGTHPTGVSEELGMTVLRKEKLDGFLIARLGDDDGIATTFVMLPTGQDAATATWDMLPPVPNIYYDSSGNVVDRRQDTNPNNDFARGMRYPAADRKGRLYAVKRRDNAPDSILKLDTSTSQWSLMKPVPRDYYASDGTVRTDSQVANNLSDLATDGGDRVYTRFARDGIDTVYVIDQSQPDASWTKLPPVPLVTYDSSGSPQEYPGRYVGSLVDYAADTSGNLFARYPRDGVDTLYRYDAAGGSWGTLPPAPRSYYVNTGEGPRLVQASGAAGNLKSLEVGGEGQVYAVFSRDGVDTIFSYDGSSKAWTVLPPVPALRWLDSSQQISGGSEQTAATNLSATAADGEGRLFVKWGRDGMDQLFGYDPDRSRYDLLPPIPYKKWRTNGTLLDNSGRSGNKGVVGNIHSIAGGGRPPSSGGGYRFVTVGTF